MVVLKNDFPRFTPEEYFAWEEQQLSGSPENPVAVPKAGYANSAGM
jgi:hypothetical protein